MNPDERSVARLDLEIASDDEWDALERALLRARAAELSEVRRREVRLVAGYGDATSRESMTGEGAAAKRRYQMLERLLEALRASRRP